MECSIPLNDGIALPSHTRWNLFLPNFLTEPSPLYTLRLWSLGAIFTSPLHASLPQQTHPLCAFLHVAESGSLGRFSLLQATASASVFSSASSTPPRRPPLPDPHSFAHWSAEHPPRIPSRIESAKQILEKRKMDQTMLANQSTLLDLLEIPQLMDTCVQNGNYDEALDLEAFVCELSTMHPKLPVIQASAAEVRQTTQSLLSQLI